MQGETDAEAPAAYQDMLQALVYTWRSALPQPRGRALPLVVVQLPAHSAAAGAGHSVVSDGRDVLLVACTITKTRILLRWRTSSPLVLPPQARS